MTNITEWLKNAGKGILILGGIFAISYIITWKPPGYYENIRVSENVKFADKMVAAMKECPEKFQELMR